MNKLLLLPLVLFMGCASLPGEKISKIQNREIAYVIKGEGNPAVVLETGLGPTMSTWDAVYEDVARITRVFAYNRPGYGRSSVGTTPESLRDLADQLRQNLLSTGLKPPYVLVGHSAGGLYVNYYARVYPQEVAGAVLIDSSHPAQFEYFKSEKPLMHALFVVSTSTGRNSYESRILKNMHNEFKDVGPFPDVPLVVLTAGKSSFIESQEMREQWLTFQRDLAAMSSRATHIIVKGGGHFVQKDKPDTVIEAIRHVVEQVRNKM